jgi:hypothetical protein
MTPDDWLDLYTEGADQFLGLDSGVYADLLFKNLTGAMRDDERPIFDALDQRLRRSRGSSIDLVTEQAGLEEGVGRGDEKSIAALQRAYEDRYAYLKLLHSAINKSRSTGTDVLGNPADRFNPDSFAPGFLTGAYTGAALGSLPGTISLKIIRETNNLGMGFFLGSDESGFSQSEEGREIIALGEQNFGVAARDAMLVAGWRFQDEKKFSQRVAEIGSAFMADVGAFKLFGRAAAIGNAARGAQAIQSAIGRRVLEGAAAFGGVAGAKNAVRMADGEISIGKAMAETAVDTSLGAITSGLNHVVFDGLMPRLSPSFSSHGVPRHLASAVFDSATMTGYDWAVRGHAPDPADFLAQTLFFGLYQTGPAQAARVTKAVRSKLSTPTDKMVARHQGTQLFRILFGARPGEPGVIDLESIDAQSRQLLLDKLGVEITEGGNINSKNPQALREFFDVFGANILASLQAMRSRAEGKGDIALGLAVSPDLVDAMFQHYGIRPDLVASRGKVPPELIEAQEENTRKLDHASKVITTYQQDIMAASRLLDASGIPRKSLLDMSNLLASRDLAGAKALVKKLQEGDSPPPEAVTNALDGLIERFGVFQQAQHLVDGLSQRISQLSAVMQDIASQAPPSRTAEQALETLAGFSESMRREGEAVDEATESMARSAIAGLVSLEQTGKMPVVARGAEVAFLRAAVAAGGGEFEQSRASHVLTLIRRAGMTIPYPIGSDYNATDTVLSRLPEPMRRSYEQAERASRLEAKAQKPSSVLAAQREASAAWESTASQMLDHFVRKFVETTIVDVAPISEVQGPEGQAKAIQERVDATMDGVKVALGLLPASHPLKKSFAHLSDTVRKSVFQSARVTLSKSYLGIVEALRLRSDLALSPDAVAKLVQRNKIVSDLSRLYRQDLERLNADTWNDEQQKKRAMQQLGDKYSAEINAAIASTADQDVQQRVAFMRLLVALQAPESQRKAEIAATLRTLGLDGGQARGLINAASQVIEKMPVGQLASGAIEVPEIPVGLREDRTRAQEVALARLSGRERLRLEGMNDMASNLAIDREILASGRFSPLDLTRASAVLSGSFQDVARISDPRIDEVTKSALAIAAGLERGSERPLREEAERLKLRPFASEEAEQRALALRASGPESPVTSGEASATREILGRQASRLRHNGDPNAPLMAFVAAARDNRFALAVQATPYALNNFVSGLREPSRRGRAVGLVLGAPTEETRRIKVFIDAAEAALPKIREMAAADRSAAEVLNAVVGMFPAETHVADVARFLQLVGVDGIVAIPDAVGMRFGEQMWGRLKIGAFETASGVDAYLRLSDRLRQEWSDAGVYTSDMDLSIDLRHATSPGFGDVGAMTKRAFSGPAVSPVLIALDRLRSAADAASALQGQPRHDLAVREVQVALAEFRAAGGRIERLAPDVRSGIVAALLSRRPDSSSGKLSMDGVAEAARAATQVVVDAIPESPAAIRIGATAKALERVWVKAVRAQDEGMARRASAGLAEVAGVEFEAHPDQRVRHRIRSGTESLLVLEDGSVIIEPPLIKSTIKDMVELSQIETQAGLQAHVSEMLANPGQTEKTRASQWAAAAVASELQQARIEDPHGALRAVDQISYEGHLAQARGITVTLWNGKQIMFRDAAAFRKWMAGDQAKRAVDRFKQSGRVGSGMLVVGGSLVTGGLLFSSGHWLVGAAFTAAPVAALLRARQNQRSQREIMEKSYPFMSDWMKRAYEENEKASVGIGQALRTFVSPLFSITRAGGRLYGPAKDAYLYLRGTTIDGQEIGMGPYTRFHNQGIASLGIRGWSELHSDLFSLVGRLGGPPMGSKIRTGLHAGTGMSFLAQWIASKSLATVPVKDWTPEKLIESTMQEYARIENAPRARSFFDQRFLVEPDAVDVAFALESLSPKQRELLQESARMLRYLRSREIKAARRLWKLRELGDVNAEMTPNQVLTMHDTVFEAVGPTIAAYVTNLTFDRLRDNRNRGLSLLQTQASGISPNDIESKLNALVSEVLSEARNADKLNTLSDRIAAEFGMDRQAHSTEIAELSDALLTFGSMEQTPPHRYGLTRQMFTPWYIKRMREEQSTIDFVRAMEAYVPGVLRRVFLEEAVHRANWTAMQNFKIDPDLQREMLAMTAMVTSNPGDMMPLGGPESWMQRDPAGRALSRLAYWKVLWFNPSQVFVETMGYLANPSGYTRPFWHFSKAKSVFLDKDLGRFIADLAHVNFIADHAAPFHGDSYGLMGLYGRIMGLKEGPVDFAGKTAGFFQALDELREVGRDVLERKEPIGALTSRLKFLARRGEEYGQFLALAELITRTHSLAQGIHFWTTEALESAGGSVQRITDRESGIKYNAVVMPDGRSLDPFEVFAESYATKRGEQAVRNPRIAGEQLVDPDEIMKRAIIDTDSALSVYSGVNISPFIRQLKQVPVVGKPVSAFSNWSMNYMNKMAFDFVGGFLGRGSYPERERQIMRSSVRRRLLGIYLVGGVGAYKIALDMMMTGMAGAVNLFLNDDSGAAMPRSTEDPRWEDFTSKIDEAVWPLKPSNPLFGTLANISNALWKESTGRADDVIPELTLGEKLQPNVPILSARFVDRDASWAVLLGPGTSDAAYDLWTLTQRDALLRAGDKESVSKYYDAAVNLMGSKAASLYLGREVGGSPFPRSNPFFSVGLYKLGNAAAETMNWWKWKESGGIPGDPRFLQRTPSMEPLRSIPIDPMESWSRAILGQTASQAEFARGFRRRTSASRSESLIREMIGSAAFDASSGGNDFGVKLAEANRRAWVTLPVFRVDDNGKRRLVTPEESKRAFLPSEAETMGFAGLHPTVVGALLGLKQAIKREARDRALTREEQNILSLSHREQGQAFESAKMALIEKGFLRKESGKDILDLPAALQSREDSVIQAARLYVLTMATLARE